MNKIQSNKLLNVKIDQNKIIFWVYDKTKEMVFLNIKGNLGILRLNLPKVFKIAFSKQFLYLTSINKHNFGLTKTLFNQIVSNIKGVNNLYKINLVLKGIGYKVQYLKSKLYFDLGYSHKIIVNLPKSINIEITNQGTNLILTSINKIELGKIASRIMHLKPIEPYKGKGIMNALNPIKLKQGKTKTH